ncbi:hypothetical protein DFS33DRAFT_1387034 [Desarmillaria ectypa]|nr:hypothetical protein DFS33DRAFT_1387034 [Desarmillaria ectypa]
MHLQVLKLNSSVLEDVAVKGQINQAFELFEQASSTSAPTCNIMDQLSIASTRVSQALEMKHHSITMAYPQSRSSIAGILRPISPADVATATIMGSSNPNLAQAVELLECRRDIVLSHIHAMRQDNEHICNLGSMDSEAVVRFEAVCKQLDHNIHGLFLSSGWKWTPVFVPGKAADMKAPSTWEGFLQGHSNAMQEREEMTT